MRRPRAKDEWIHEVPRPELNKIHHALRMLATHPMTEDRNEVEALADRFWDESVRRGQLRDD